MQKEGDMNVLKPFLAGAFLGAGAFGALTHASWTSSLSKASFIPAITAADLIEIGGAALAGTIAVAIVLRDERRHGPGAV